MKITLLLSILSASGALAVLVKDAGELGFEMPKQRRLQRRLQRTPMRGQWRREYQVAEDEHRHGLARDVADHFALLLFRAKTFAGITSAGSICEGLLQLHNEGEFPGGQGFYLVSDFGHKFLFRERQATDSATR
ncbi:uncharacterized protein MYCGRDRAFT_94851 [Zymoseptoria tritici IPO323]|uniref:Uncharacterized protein n=1 Tax=Zymoseptoria tritici (strain CBS 115943 / IPO323) TaxID=336722 RepID=F9XFH8_ZYMTI|nr:uncharacterized protein MYCGRDRAFT_94851 [Zymoseptoria tritici IPO323]EGP85909.1 hypothetical protein MYCGRDRAFT_94851 [Zymoseptoria tritici IPO323]